MKYFILFILFIFGCISHFSASYAFADNVEFKYNDLFMGTNGGKVFHYSSTGSLLDTLQTDFSNSIATPLCFDHAHNLRVSNSVNNTMTLFNNQGVALISSWGGSYAGLPTRCVTDKSGNVYVYTSEIFGNTNLIRKFTPTGTLVDSYAPEYDTTNTGTSFTKGLYSMDLANDNCTLLYTAVPSLSRATGVIKRFNLCTDTQLPDFAELPTLACTDIRIRPNQEVITTCGANLYRLTALGELITTYTPKDKELMPQGQISYSLDLDPDSKSFWAGGNFSGNVYHIAFANGSGTEQKVFALPAADPIWNTLVGLIVYPESSIDPTPTEIPAPSLSPTPEPFLDLPWDYQKDGTDFEDVAFNPFSWFDHEYPLQNKCCEPPVLLYTGELSNQYYRSHSGYDYALQDGIHLNTPVLASAAGFASFVPESKSGGGGNVIKIDHENGYQTWYEHLSSANLVVNTEGQKVFVTKGQPIGKVGMTGNTTGPHIHLSVFKDSNHNGSFMDDSPYGLVDPLGWESRTVDPWTQYGNGEKHGETSYNLFLARAKPSSATIPVTGGTLLAHNTNVQVIVPADASSSPFTLTYKAGSFSSFTINGVDFASLSPSFFLEAINASGEQLTQFQKPIRIIYHYSGINFFNIKESSLLIYYLNEQTNQWQALPSIVDTINKTVTTETTHFSHFAVMGEKKDVLPPMTDSVLQGTKGESDWYRSSVKVSLTAKDTNDGLGVEDILYQIDNGEWQQYTKPFLIEKDGEHTLSYFSFDKSDNRESIKTKHFVIDTTPPEAAITYDVSLFDFIVSGKDALSSTNVQQKKTSLATSTVTIVDKAGNTLKLETKKLKAGTQATFSIEGLQYNTAKKVSVDKNLFVTLVTTAAKNHISILDQYLSFNEETKLYSTYTQKSDKTEIYRKVSSYSYQKEVKPDIVLLQLFTEKGKLKYRY